jgi:alpha-L-fucosidase
MNNNMKSVLLLGLMLTARLSAEDANPSGLIMPDETESPRMKACRDMHYQGRKYYVGYENNDITGDSWHNAKTPRPVDELFEVYKKNRQCGGNLLLDVGPTEAGIVLPAFHETLLALKRKIDAYEKSTSANSKTNSN